ncbi:hypothetical protein COCNU_01G016430 [Cocos nucifera]|uniref:Uncharacterized protein n=1 Tax=Cocos nucifera TaxID=13894 RepID=A0A8K0HWZ7_COCNU|nr:hypothetical protein COCNU_01G016430 [Cocos nucifera]
MPKVVDQMVDLDPRRITICSLTSRGCIVRRWRHRRPRRTFKPRSTIFKRGSMRCFDKALDKEPEEGSSSSEEEVEEDGGQPLSLTKECF